MDDEYEEEEILFYMDFDSKIGTAETLIEKQLKIVGVDTDEPILQLGSQVFKGEWKDAMGTCVFFDKDPNYTIVGDPLFCEIPSEGMLKFVCKTDKVLHMSRIFVKPKAAAAAAEEQHWNKTEDGQENDCKTEDEPPAPVEHEAEAEEEEEEEETPPVQVYKTEEEEEEEEEMDKRKEETPTPMECDDREATTATGDLKAEEEQNITSAS